ncbi:hypothetical protein [Effusibacillus lacus]|uniref:Uncharacterized protein n=1 Tax=Effusibacillus lacus TaxID=1348429 RepID=A0A292YKB8_9BACL|nr:hypothetical protein [Effusibacillus lacus]GAX88824.1 hypothetical protein EFBL_0438 [Effusibacillus lacus]
MNQVHHNVLFMSLDMTGNDVEYSLQRIDKDLDKLDKKLNHLEQDLSLLMFEIECRLRFQHLSQAI